MSCEGNLHGRHADGANLADHVALGVGTNCGASEPGAAQDQGQVLAGALGARAGCEALRALGPGGAWVGGEDDVVANTELHRASAHCVCLSQQCTDEVLSAWAERHRLGKSAGLTGECGSKACDGAGRRLD